MKAITGLVVLAFVSTAAGEDPIDGEERIRARAEKLAAVSSHMSHHLREQGVGHSETASASSTRRARKDERSRKVKEPSAKAEHAEKIRRVADQISEQHRKHMERPMPHDLHKVRAAQHSLADMKTSKGSREPSSATARAAKNARRKESLGELAKYMSHHFGATGPVASDAAVKGDLRRIKTAHDVDGRVTGHGEPPMRGGMDGSRLKGMQHRVEQVSPKKLHRIDANDEGSNPAEEGQE
eukprot:g7364.t1